MADNKASSNEWESDYEEIEQEPNASREETVPSRKNVSEGNTPSESEKKIMRNCYKYVKKTWSGNKEDLEKKVAEIVGVDITYLRAALPKESASKRRRRELKQFDERAKNIVRKKVHEVYNEGQRPTITKVLDLINKDPNLPNLSLSSFERLYEDLNFRLQPGSDILIDKGKIAIRRLNFLRRIEELRKENRPIYYLDEVFIQTGKKVGEEWKKTLTVAILIGSEKGFLEDGEAIFEHPWNKYDEIKEVEFESWFEKILPKLEKNAVVVMDFAMYHLRLHEEFPDQFWNKADIHKWLKSKGIPYKDDEFKAELIMRIKEKKDLKKLFAINELAKNFNIDVLRLPPYHNDLNAMDYVWRDVLGKVEKKENLTFDEAKNMILEGMKQVTPEKWKEYAELVLKEEERFYRGLDYKIDDVIDEFIEELDQRFSDEEFYSSTDSYPE